MTAKLTSKEAAATLISAGAAGGSKKGAEKQQNQRGAASKESRLGAGPDEGLSCLSPGTRSQRGLPAEVTVRSPINSVHTAAVYTRDLSCLGPVSKRTENMLCGLSLLSVKITCLKL